MALRDGQGVPGEVRDEGALAPGDLAEVMFGEETLDVVLELVVNLACSTISRADWVSVTLVDSGRKGMTTRGATSQEVREMDRAQYELEEGPCVEASTSGEVRNVVVVNGDTAPYPEFARQARQHGVGSILSTPLMVRDRSMGALNVYSKRPEKFDDAQMETAAAFARRASVVLGNAVAFMSVEMVNEQLREALESRDLIGQAKGILMARQGCSADEAFDVLRRASQRENRKLRELAADVVQAARQQPEE